MVWDRLKVSKWSFLEFYNIEFYMFSDWIWRMKISQIESLKKSNFEISISIYLIRPISTIAIGQK